MTGGDDMKDAFGCCQGMDECQQRDNDKADKDGMAM